VRYRITHRTSYNYSSPAWESFNEVRLQPVTEEGQTCLDFGLTIDPPASVIAFRDYYGNAVHDFSVPYLHDELVVEATSDVIVAAGIDEPLAGPGLDEDDVSPQLLTLAADEQFIDDQIEFLTASTYVGLGEASREFAQALVDEFPGQSAYSYFIRAGVAVHQRLTYQIGITTVHTTVSEVLAVGSGVCQDFAHVLIALCRQVGLPARYVSGYLGGEGEATASHAWAEAFIPPYGWIGFDATSGLRCTGRHVKIGVGRDYADVSVMRGTYRGGTSAKLEVTVRTETLTGGRSLVSMKGAGGARGRGELIQYQSIGAIKQLQRLRAMSQSLTAMADTIEQLSHDIEGGLAGMPGELPEQGAPHQQPQQQQQSQ
jgi:transglutaminase-like putative cysteine protease